MFKIIVPVATALTIATGCQSNTDHVVAELATRHATEQAELSRETVALQSELVDGTQQLVGSDAQARRDFLELESRLDEQRAEISQRRDALAQTQRELTKQQARAPVVANALLAVGTTLTCLLPLLLAGYLLRYQLDRSSGGLAADVLLDEIAAVHQELFSPQQVAFDHAIDETDPRLGEDAQPQDGPLKLSDQ